VIRSVVRRWRANEVRLAPVAGESFRLRYPFSRFDPGSERVLLDAFVSVAKPGVLVYDIGANAGIYSLLAARLGARVVAFEPAAAAATLLREHLALNAIEIELVEDVVSDSEGTVTFYEQGSATTSSLSEASARTGEHFVSDPVLAVDRRSTTIDSFSRRRGAWPHVIKLDVEGAELLALRGAVEWLGRRRGVLLVEIHPWSLAQLGASADDVLDLLGSHGWEPRLLGDNGNTSHYRVEPLDKLVSHH
jgi:FkbM family methyltransferase